MNEPETIHELDNAINNMIDAVYSLNKAKKSDHIYQARIEQFTCQIETMIDQLEDIRDDGNELIYADVRRAIDDDRQYAAESIIYWWNKGHGLSEIAGWLHTSVNVLTDLIDEYTEE